MTAYCGKRPAATVPDTLALQARGFVWEGPNAQAGDIEKEDVVTLCFPVGEHTETIDIEKRTYRVLPRGNTCAVIDSPGVGCPLFEANFAEEMR
ncbi:MAG: hypothetical protein QF541_20790 [Lentisphaeria bacterium]|nr:hypothetical protein [Lentisphaeria bacterium]